MVHDGPFRFSLHMSPGNGKYCTRDDAKLFSYLYPYILYHPFRKFHHSVRNYFPYDSRSLVRSSVPFIERVDKHLNTFQAIVREKIRVRDWKSRSTITKEKSAWLWQISGSATNFDIRRGIPLRHGVMEHGVFRLHSSKSSWERGHEIDMAKPGEKERRNGGGCFNEIAVMPCKWLGNSFRGFLCPAAGLHAGLTRFHTYFNTAETVRKLRDMHKRLRKLGYSVHPTLSTLPAQRKSR